jgi:putative ergosteryl-3beta-O-L-aspartate hydrolase
LNISVGFDNRTQKQEVSTSFEPFGLSEITPPHSVLGTRLVTIKMESVEAIPLPPAVHQEVEGPKSKLPPGKTPSKKVDNKTGLPPSRFSLRMSANWWRSLQRIGMFMHRLARPRPPNPDFTKKIPSTLSARKGEFTLQFYVPEGYHRLKTGGKSEKKGVSATTWPVVVNFHGGGFTIGEATDDARFARFVVQQCSAIFVSVDYRLAPEYAFPTAVDDGADAILYLIRHATELYINPFKLATSGFSAGANIAMTALMRLASYFQTAQSSAPIPDHRILAVAPWYPILDYTLTRKERRESSVRPDQALSSTLTNLFDASYLYPPGLDLANPLLSPSKASDELLICAVPPHVLFYTCEWDMLLREGEEFAKRLAKPPISRKVDYKMIPGVTHGWDKGPNPLMLPPHSEELYRGCCARLKEIFEKE